LKCCRKIREVKRRPRIPASRRNASAVTSEKRMYDY
jgi:hypothetical protein